MRAHLRWILAGALLTVVIALTVNAVHDNRDEREREQARSPEALDRRMASFGYRRAQDRGETYQSAVLGAVAYVYCPTEQECDTPAGNADHPPVDVYGWVPMVVHVWWPTAPSAKDSPLAGTELTACVGGAGAASIANDEWPQTVAALSQQAWAEVVQVLVSSPQSVPAPAGDAQIIAVDGWQCPVPTGKRPFG